MLWARHKRLFWHTLKIGITIFGLPFYDTLLGFNSSVLLILG